MDQEQKQQQFMANSFANQIANQAVRIAELESIISMQQEEIKEYREKEIKEMDKDTEQKNPKGEK